MSHKKASATLGVLHERINIIWFCLRRMDCLRMAHAHHRLYRARGLGLSDRGRAFLPNRLDSRHRTLVWVVLMRIPGATITTLWYEVRDEHNIKFRRFQTMEEAEYFAQDSWTIEKVTTVRQLFVPEEAPF